MTDRGASKLRKPPGLIRAPKEDAVVILRGDPVGRLKTGAAIEHPGRRAGLSRADTLHSGMAGPTSLNLLMPPYAIKCIPFVSR